MKSFTTISWVLLGLVVSVFSHDDEAESIDVATFKSSFADAEIVPDVLAAFNPSVSFYVSFALDDGDAGLLTPGMNLTKTEAKAPFELSVENIAGANVTSSTRYIVYMIGPDVPSRSSPTSRNVRHFLAANLTLGTANSSVLTTARLLTNSTAATNEYAAPAPAANTGIHRYVYLFYTQPEALNKKSFADIGFNISNRLNFNLTAFRTLAGLGPSVGGTYFLIDTDSDSASNDTASGSTTSSGGSSSPTGSTSDATAIGPNYSAAVGIAAFAWIYACII